MLLKWVQGVLVAVLIGLPPVVQAETMPDELVRTVTTEILSLLKTNKPYYTEDKNRLYKMVDEKILPHFDFRKMSQWVLGIHWRRASDLQRAAFTTEFRKLLVRTYATALLKYTDQEIVQLPYTGKPDDKITVVKTEIKQKTGEPNVALYYTFYNRRPGWKIFDLTIEGVSLVANYRKVYSTRIQRDGLENLIKNLAAQNIKASKNAVKKTRSRNSSG
ncbi:MAG: phospholipid-binding protein MlaC [Acidiferrobacterales bacterium]